MIVVNLYGGPGVGKSTLAATLFAELKKRGYDVELVGDVAREMLRDGIQASELNEVLIAATQYNRLINLEKRGCEIAISDSPIKLGCVYIENADTWKYRMLYDQVEALLRAMDRQFWHIDFLVEPGCDYDARGRVQTAAKAKELHDKIYNLVQAYAVKCSPACKEDVADTVHAIEILHSMWASHSNKTA